MPRTILRQCIHCRQQLPRESMLCLTSNRDHHFSINGNPPLQGRSSYVCRNKACLTEALRAKKFQRTLKRAIPDAILEALNDQLKGISSL
ncbi:YlxR family protein [Vampirovibrio chlorellavorus]|uniref:YlxR family protein n=1 Tax=Vampirovibrio chlorellavorus TaxID=758823 RepID=UPI003FCCE805